MRLLPLRRAAVACWTDAWLIGWLTAVGPVAAEDATPRPTPTPVADNAAQRALRRALAEVPYRLLFETNRDGNFELYVANADGTGMRNLTATGDVDEVSPRVSPDGKHIAFVADTDGKWRNRVRDIYLMTIEGKDRRKIADDARDPTWSADGRFIAYLPSEPRSEYKSFSLETWATKGLRIYDVATGTTTDHPNSKLEHIYAFDWSRDGRWLIATVHGGMGFGHTLLAIAANGSAVHDLDRYGCRPDLTLAGDRVVWSSSSHSLDIARLELNGERPQLKDVHTLVRGRTEDRTFHADWSPDGRFIAYSSGPKAAKRQLSGDLRQNPGVDAPGWNLRIVDVETANTVQITVDGKSYKEPDWIPAPRAAPR